MNKSAEPGPESEGVGFTDWIIVPIDIRPGVVARLQLPRQMTKAEAEKIARVVLAYADAGAST